MRKWPDWPVYGLETDLLAPAEACLYSGEPFALATLVRSTGPSPRPLGSEMLVTSAGQAHGYVSGGCVEAAVAAEALACLQDGIPRLLDYGNGSDILDIQLTCGGRIHILVRTVQEPEWWVSQLRRAHLARSRVAVDIELATGNMRLAEDGQASTGGFVQEYLPPIRLFLVGGDPVTLATAMLATAMGIEVVLWRPDGPRAPPPGIQLHAYLSRSPRDGLDSISLDAYSAIYCLTHDIPLDVLILRHALASDAFCVGVLGSRSKQVTRRLALIEAGATDVECSRLRSPAGLAIGAVTPQEIAISVLAEIVAFKPTKAGPEFAVRVGREGLASA